MRQPADDLVAQTLALAAQLCGWRRWGLAAFAGAAAALAMAPFHLTPILAIAYPTLILLIDGAATCARPVRSAFAAGWFFGFGYFLVGLYWLAFSFFVDADQFAWMAPFAVLGMPAFLALFTGGATALAVRFWRRGWRRIFIFAVAMMALEYARGHVLTGFPWNAPGQALAGTAAGAQTAAWWGAYGLGLIVVLIAAAPAAFVDNGRRGLARGLAAAAIATAALFTVGAVRLMLVDPGDRDDVFVRIVQPNISQREKNDQDLWWRNLDRQIALSSGPAPDRARMFVIWPENAAPVIDEVDSALSEISARLPKSATLIAGAVRRETGPDDVARYYNSIAFIPQTPAGRVVVGAYDKHHLAPFGEYLPMQRLLRAVGLAQLAPYEDGFTMGDGPRTVVSLGDPAFAPLVCYEAIFPGAIYPKSQRPEWIVTVTNDAWFGDTSGPRQHLDQARLRTIETGLPMARAANTGISALFDAAGRYRGRIRLYTAGVLDLPLPKPATATIYTRFGDLTFWGLMLAAALIAGFPAGNARPANATFARR